MEHIGKIVAYLILAINAFLVGTLILSAYSPYLNPKVNPLASSLGLAFPIFLTINLLFLVFWAFINYRYALLPIIGFLVCIPQIRTYIPFNSTTKTIPEGSIKLLSYNVMSFSNLEKKNGKNPVLSYLADSKADIICLQEHPGGVAGLHALLNGQVLLLVVGPPMEEKYGSLPLLKGILLTALISGVCGLIRSNAKNLTKS